jgi:hypothetical protein
MSGDAFVMDGSTRIHARAVKDEPELQASFWQKRQRRQKRHFVSTQ